MSSIAVKVIADADAEGFQKKLASFLTSHGEVVITDQMVYGITSRQLDREGVETVYSAILPYRLGWREK